MMFVSYSDDEIPNALNQLEVLREFAQAHADVNVELFHQYLADNADMDLELDKLTLELIINQLIFAVRSGQFDYSAFYNLGFLLNHNMFVQWFQNLTNMDIEPPLCQSIFESLVDKRPPPPYIIKWLAGLLFDDLVLSIGFGGGLIEGALQKELVDVHFTDCPEVPDLINPDETPIKVSSDQLTFAYRSHGYYFTEVDHMDALSAIEANPTCNVLLTCYPEEELFGPAVNVFQGDSIIVISDKPDLTDFMAMNDELGRWKIESVTPFLSCFSERAYVHIYVV